MDNQPVFRATEQAIDLMRKGDYNAAVSILQSSALRRNPKARRSRLYLGLARARQCRFEDAEEILTCLIAENSGDLHATVAQCALNYTVFPGKKAQ